MYFWGLPLGCLFLVIALLAATLAMDLTDEAGVRIGFGVAALFLYAGVICVHYFELAGSPGQTGRYGPRG
jgi:hypothetical protein